MASAMKQISQPTTTARPPKASMPKPAATNVVARQEHGRLHRPAIPEVNQLYLQLLEGTGDAAAAFVRPGLSSAAAKAPRSRPAGSRRRQRSGSVDINASEDPSVILAQLRRGAEVLAARNGRQAVGLGQGMVALHPLRQAARPQRPHVACAQTTSRQWFFYPAAEGPSLGPFSDFGGTWGGGGC